MSGDGGRGLWSTRDRDIINRWAYIGDKIIHGQPSGVDNTLSTYGKNIAMVLLSSYLCIYLFRFFLDES